MNKADSFENCNKLLCGQFKEKSQNLKQDNSLPGWYMNQVPTHADKMTKEMER